MRKFYFAIIITLVSLSSSQIKAQSQLPNPGFEFWTDTITCDNWNSNNMNIVFASYNFVTRSASSNTGYYAAKIQSKSVPLLGTMPGICTVGNYSMLTGFSGGIPINGKPFHLKGYYKYLPVNGDTMAIIVVMTKWNSAAQTRDTLCYTGIMAKTTVSNYTAFSIPLTYTPSTATPDTVNVIAVSSAGYAPQEGSTLFIDDFLFNYSGAGIEEISTNSFKAFPNPAVNQLTLVFNYEEVNSVEFIDMMGKVVMSKSTSAETEDFDVSGLSEGMYIVRVGNKKGSSSLKVSIQR